MPAPKMLAALPKPLLFGLYGALGGLIGALAFGELLWFLLKPPPAPPPEPRVAVGAPTDVQIYQGGTNRLIFQIARDGFEGPVSATATGLPAGVTAKIAVVDDKRTESELVLECAPGATPTGTPVPVKITASARVNGKEVAATAETQLSVLAAPMPQADIVFVLDVTGSMQAQINGLRNGIGTFAGDLFRAKVDARFACLAFRDRFIGEPDELLKFKGDTFTSDAAAFRDEVGRLRADGGGDDPETSYEAIASAAALPDFRKSAVRVLVLITDAPPKGTPQGTGARAATDALGANRIDSLHLVVNPRDLGFYTPVQQGAVGVGDKNPDRGRVFDFLRAASDAGLMTRTLLPEMTKAIIAAAETKRPAPPVRDERPRAATLKSLQSKERVAAGNEVLVVARSGVWTGAIAALVCLALVVGQHHYLRGGLPGAGSVLAGLGGGLVVGLVGGAAGQGLYFLAPESAVLGAVVRVLGWALLGALAGAGLSFFVPNLKLPLGLLGGAVGGTAGAIAYLGAEAVAGDLVGRLAGGLALGFCIGLMVAVIEAAFRRAWLEVSYGPRETVTVNLGAEPVKIGGDARACTVWARGAPEIALRYFLRDGQVICTDVPNRDEFPVRDGDSRAVGNVTVVVRTGSGTAPPSPRAPRPASPPAPKAKPAPPPIPAARANDSVPDIDDLLPMPVSPAAPPAPRPAPKPPLPPIPGASAPKPPAPPAPKPPAPPAAAPAIKPAARDPDACPQCGRKNAGRPGSRYCMVCDQTY
jgi:von Willebrand factor type A domain